MKITVEDFLSKAKLMALKFAESHYVPKFPRDEIKVRVDNVHACIGKIDGLFMVTCLTAPPMYIKVHYADDIGSYGLLAYKEIGHTIFNGER